VVHGFALTSGAGDYESPIGRVTAAAAVLERVTVGDDSGSAADEREPPNRAPGAVEQHAARDLSVPDVADVRPGRPLSGELRIEHDRPGTRGDRHRR
jgi:hypothetical protein